MERSTARTGDEGRRPRGGGGSASADPLVREVRWQLFRREDMPSRLRRLQRLEEIVEAEHRAHGAGPGNTPPGR
jgi:hypothetical protein